MSSLNQECAKGLLWSEDDSRFNSHFTTNHMAKCYVSGKTTQFGRSHTHHRGVAGGRWKKRAQKTPRFFKANLQSVTILENGSPKKVKLATDVIKRVKKDIREGKNPIVQLAYLSADLKKVIADRKAATKQSAS